MSLFFTAITFATYLSYAVETEQKVFSGSLTQTGKTYTVNSTSQSIGGAIASTSATSLTLTDCVFKDCIGGNGTAEQKVSGVALIMEAQSTLTMTNVNFTNCKEAAIGVICGAQTTVSLTSVLVSETKTTYYPAVGIQFTGSSANLTINKCYFLDNTNTDGHYVTGALGVTFTGSSHNVKVTNCDFFNNKHTGLQGIGGVSFLFSEGANNLTASSCCFGSNTGAVATDVSVDGWESGGLVTVNLKSTSPTPRIWPASFESEITEGTCKNQPEPPSPGPAASGFFAKPRGLHLVLTLTPTLFAFFMMFA